MVIVFHACLDRFYVEGLYRFDYESSDRSMPLPACNKQSIHLTLCPHRHCLFLATAEKFTNQVDMDLGTKYKTARSLYLKEFDQTGRRMSLAVTWHEKGSEIGVWANYKPDMPNEISAS